MGAAAFLAPLSSDREPALRATIAGLRLAHDAHDPLAALGELAGAGLLRECVPAAYGGAAARLSLRALCVVREALGHDSPLHDLMFVMQGLGSYAVTLAGSEAQRQALLPAIAQGRAVGAFALTEPDAGSDVSSIAAAARRTPEGYVLDGQKTFISNAGVATQYLLFARTGEHPQKGLSAFLVPASAAGLSVTPLHLLSGEHPIGRLSLRGVSLPEQARVGQEGEGLALALRTLGLFRASVGAVAVGMARRALAEAIAHVRRRVQFGKRLAEFQGTQLALAEMATQVDAAALLVQRAAYQVDAAPQDSRDPQLGTACAMAKLFATEAAQQVIDRSLQLHGGSGLVAGCVIERLYREVRALRIYEGTSEIQKLVIARDLLRE